MRLEMDGIWKAFGGVLVLRDVRLKLKAGEVLALLGQNGAGKSTLIKILSGDYTRDAGTIRLDGEEVAFATPREAVAHGVRVLPQELSVVPDLSVAENIVIGGLPTRRRLGLPLVDRRNLRRAAEEALAQLAAGIDPSQPLKVLSAPEQRIVEIARALAGRARVLVMDEPTAALTAQETDRLFQIIERLRQQGVSVIYISHRLDEVFRISDRIAVLRDGRNTGDFQTSQASRKAVLDAMIGEPVEELYPGPGSGEGEPVLEIEDLTVGNRVTGATFDVRRGEIVGAFGLIGSGIDVLGKALIGALELPRRGEVRLGGRPFSPSSPGHAREVGVGYVPAERKREGILPDMSVRENITLPFIRRFVRRGSVSVAAEEDYVRHWMCRLAIQARGTSQKVRYLSGGNQQKVVLSRWLVGDMKLLIVDEPTRGVDVAARAGIYATLRRLASDGLAVLMISSDVEEVAGVCDRMLVFDRGRIAGRHVRGVSPQELMNRAAGVVHEAL